MLLTLQTRTRIAALTFLAITGSACSTSLRDNVEKTSNRLASLVNNFQTAAIQTYEIQKEVAIRKVAEDGGNREDAEVVLSQIRQSWLPVWEAFAGTAASHAVLVSLLERSRNGEEELLTQLPEILKEVEEAWAKTKRALCLVRGTPQENCTP